jgi:hypothetical protein
MGEGLIDIIEREEVVETGSIVYFRGEEEPVGVPAGNFLGYGPNTFNPNFFDLLWGVPYVLFIEPLLHKLGYN